MKEEYKTTTYKRNTLQELLNQTLITLPKGITGPSLQVATQIY